MNVLSTVPQNLAHSGALEQYFRDMSKWGFDVACCKFVATPGAPDDFADMYKRFTQAARSSGLPSCISIDVSRCATDILPLSEAQHDRENKPIMAAGDSLFIASLASDAWINRLKELVSRFVSDYGFEWVLFTEPTYLTDVPGQSDPVHRAFQRACPDIDYPHASEETAAYLHLQRLKHHIITVFASELSSHAKATGAKLVGVVTPHIDPTIEADPDGREGTYNSANGSIAALPDVDFIAVKIGPEMYGKPLEVLNKSIDPLHYYADTLAHATGKPVVAFTDSINPAETPSDPTSPEGLPLRRALLAAIGAGLNGLGFDWMPDLENPSKDAIRFVRTVNRSIARTALQRSPVGFLFSGSSTTHVDGKDYQHIWPHYWSIMEHLLDGRKWPTQTISAESLEHDLNNNPLLRVVVIEEHFPLTREQTNVLLRWWSETPEKSIVVVGSGVGLSADPNRPGQRSIDEAFPGLFEHIGLRLHNPPQIGVGDDERLRLALRGTHLPHLPEDGDAVDTRHYAHIGRIFGMGARVLYTDDENRPIIVQWKMGDTSAFFVGLETSKETANVIGQVIKQALIVSGVVFPPPVTADHRSLWSSTRGGYVVVANCTDTPSVATVTRHPYAYWDIVERRLVRDDALKVDVPPHSLRPIRWLSKTGKLYDVEDAVYLKSITGGAGRAEITLWMRPETRFIVRSTPRRVSVDGEPCRRITSENAHSYVAVSLDGISPGEHIITMQW